MRINIKIDPDYYPIIIILAFVVGFVLAIALGFTPQHGGDQDRQGYGFANPAMIETVAAWDGYAS